MTVIREITTVKANGAVEVRNPSFPVGQQVEVIVVLPSPAKNGDDPYAFLKILEAANVEGPVDWSENLSAYLRDRSSLRWGNESFLILRTSLPFYDEQTGSIRDRSTYHSLFVRTVFG